MHIYVCMNQEINMYIIIYIYVSTHTLRFIHVYVPRHPYLYVCIIYTHMQAHIHAPAATCNFSTSQNDGATSSED